MKPGYLKSFYAVFLNLQDKIIFLFIVYLAVMHADIAEHKISQHHGDTIEFSGFKWVTKDSYGKHTGPGYNYFSGSKQNVFVDDSGRLHLRLTVRNEKWYCPEVRLTESLGYGKYIFYLEPFAQPLDKDIVIGLFLYDRDDSSNFHKEIDFEFSQWGNDTAMNSQFVIQPKEEQAHRFQTDFKLPTKHVMELRKKSIAFKSYYDSSTSADAPLEIASYKVKPDYVYDYGNEKISMNVWLYHTSEPYNLKEFEVVISKFSYEPLWFDKIFKHKKKRPAE